ncbi:GAF domain-containing sensor histidine kinase [Amycolatopsis suaedae]|uniref:GAF domain-containing sensor histidine kinase n=1 Tax=Amycolatopsis suaedae TaxID=2510978 RepID=UPI001F0FAE5A|nr:GAF domain-containing sensor histidine kinase [Amycolatopsis suaedae]
MTVSLLDAVIRVTRGSGLPDVLDRLVESARELSGASRAVLGVHDTGGRFADVVGGLDHDAFTALLRDPSPSALVLPISVLDADFGVLYLDGARFGDAERETLGTLLAAASSVIERAIGYEESRRRERWLQASYDVTGALLSGGTLDDTLHLIAECARVVAGASAGGVARPVPDDPTRLSFDVIEPRDPAVSHLVGLTVSLEGSATGLAFATGKPVVVRRYGEHVVAEQAESSVSIPQLVRDLDSAVAVPLTVGGEPLGVLVVARLGDEVPFTDTEVSLAATFGAHAALAMEFARAEQDRQRLAVFAERDRIARDLHDLVIQRLFAIGLGLEGMSRVSGDEVVAERVAGFVRDLDQTISEVRNSIFVLQDPAVVPPGLRSDLRRLADDATESLGFEPRLRFTGPLDAAVPAPVQADLLATVREALSNVAKHAEASSVSVDVGVALPEQVLTVLVADDGNGRPADLSGDGLRALDERAGHWGGTLSVQGSAGRGTTLEWVVPLPTAT